MRHQRMTAEDRRALGHASDKLRSQQHRARQSYDRTYRRRQAILAFEDLDDLDSTEVVKITPSDPEVHAQLEMLRYTRNVKRRLDRRVRRRVILAIGSGVCIKPRAARVEPLFI